MPDQAINEMISAFAIGCMDKENFIHFKNYIESKGDLPYKELGQLQTLSSMLPAILELETPAPELKNRVARTLISMQDEIKEKIKLEKQKTIIDISRAQTEVKSDLTPPDRDVNNSGLNINQPAVREDNMNNRSSNEPVQNTYLNTENRLFAENMTQQQESPSHAPLWIAIALLFIALCVVGYFGYSSITGLKDSLAKTENSLSAIKTELRSTNEFINRNGALIDFFNYENVWVIQLSGADPLMKLSGKLFVALDDKEVLMQMNNLPTPSPENTYQLWIVTKGQTYSAGSFFVEPGNRFVKLSNVPQVPREQIVQFKITLEPKGGSVAPTGQTFAIGIGNEAIQKSMKRY